MANNAYQRGLRSELPLYNETDSNVAYLKSGYVIPSELNEAISAQLSKEDNKTPDPFGHCANCVCLEDCVFTNNNVNNCERHQELLNDIQEYFYKRIYAYLAGKDVENND